MQSEAMVCDCDVVVGRWWMEREMSHFLAGKDRSTEARSKDSDKAWVEYRQTNLLVNSTTIVWP
jgi:hypothetical protein